VKDIDKDNGRSVDRDYSSLSALIILPIIELIVVPNNVILKYI